uniref:Receptor-like serine/threonine-protein kinase n=1 Tax=Cucumis sativus TaxID=3659 RepID=A0A0A0L0M2_CUCSA
MASHCFPFPSLLLLLLFLLTPSFTVAQATSPNITLRKSLTARSSDSFWSSASGAFAFGFRQAVGGDYLLAIWFNKIDEKTVVWSANRDKLAPGGSTVVLTTSGQLILNNPAGKQIWSSTSTAPNKSVSSAVLLDNGNFILAANDSEIVWQSFDDPTDTILPSQILKKGNKLVASYSETNYSSGRFEFYMQTDGNLLLYIRNFPYDAISNYYWSTDTVNFGFQVVFNLSGSIVLIAENKTILNTLSSNNPTAQTFYQRAILDHDGVFRHYIYPRGGTGRNSSWPKAWSISKSIPSNICMTIGQSSDGGVCGFNSYCKLGDDQKPFCSCPEGYVLFDPNDVTQSCKPNFVPQSCAFPELDDFDFVSLDNSDWPQSDYGDYGHNIPVNEDWCRNECLNDCFCVAATFRDGNCWKKKFPLSFGRMDYSVGGKALIKVRRRNSTLQSRNLDKNCNNETKIIIGSILLGSLFLNILLLLLTLLIGCRFSKRKLKFNGGDPFILEQLGSGAFATVYKGTTLGSVDDNNLVAVKKLENIVNEGSGENEFKAEVSAIARTNHKNLVKLVGFCNEGEHRMLVYEFMENGSLANFVFKPSKPTWYTRIQLVLGIARGFGIMLLEMICCRKNFEMETEDEDERILSDWAYDCMNEGKMEKLIREDEEGRSDMKRVERFVKIGIWCIQEDPSLRPSMKKVIQMLEGVVEVSTPPDPSSFISAIN